VWSTLSLVVSSRKGPPAPSMRTANEVQSAHTSVSPAYRLPRASNPSTGANSAPAMHRCAMVSIASDWQQHNRWQSTQRMILLPVPDMRSAPCHTGKLLVLSRAYSWYPDSPQSDRAALGTGHIRGLGAGKLVHAKRDSEALFIRPPPSNMARLPSRSCRMAPPPGRETAVNMLSSVQISPVERQGASAQAMQNLTIQIQTPKTSPRPWIACALHSV
jgi:hypothetical protein